MQKAEKKSRHDLRCERKKTMNSKEKQVKEIANDRKINRKKLYRGIFEKHRQTLMAFGTFVKLFETTSKRKESYKVQ